MSKFLRFVNDESGATAIEYGLIAAAIGGMLIAALPTLKDAISGQFTDLSTGLNGF